MKRYILSFILLFVVSLSFSQTYPTTVQVTGGNQNIRSGPGTSYSLLDGVILNNHLVASTISSGWYYISLPNATSASYGYGLSGIGYMQPSNTGYVTIQNTAPQGLFIRSTPAGSNITIGGSNAKVWDNQKYACTGSTSIVSGATWYQIYLTMNCSQSTGWVSNGGSSNYISYNAPTTSTSNISLSGNMNFGSIQVGSSSSPQTLTISNTGTASMYVSSVSCPIGYSGSWSGNISGGSSQSVPITFSPTSATTYNSNITVNSNATSGTNTISCTGTGTSPSTSNISLSGNMNFGSIQVGSSSSPQTLTISNTGTASMYVSSISCPSGYSGSWSGNISGGGSQSVPITFSPTNATTYNSNITVNSNATSGTNTISCTGTGTTTSTIPSSNFSVSSQNILVGATITTTNNSTGNPTPTYQWTCSPATGVTISNSLATNPTVTFANTGTFTLTLSATNSQGSNSSTKVISVTTTSTVPTASFTVSNQNPNIGATITTTNNSTGNPTPTYQWSCTGTGVTISNASATNPTLNFANAGTYILTLTATNSQGTNSTNKTITVSSVAPTVQITSPNGGENWPFGTSNTITALTTGNYNVAEFSVSYDGGTSWNLIANQNTIQSSLSQSWTPSYITSNNCILKVTLFYGSGGIVNDVSDNKFFITSPTNGYAFNPYSEIAHIYWPFENSNWNSNKNSPIRNGWNGGEEKGISGGCGWGCGGHGGGDYYSDDWNNSNFEDCHQKVLSPVSGRVIYIYESCPNPPNDPCHPGQWNCPNTSNSAYLTNQVVILVKPDSNYAVRVIHLSKVLVSKGQEVTYGTPIGEIGSTGAAEHAHAHFTMYQNLNQINQGSLAIDRLKNGQYLIVGKLIPANQFAKKFVFDALPNGSGGLIGHDSTKTNYLTLCEGDTLSLSSSFIGHYRWDSNDTTQSINVNQGGLYTVSVFDSIQNIVQYEHFVVEEIKKVNSISIFSSSQVLCPNDTLLLYTNLFSPDSIGEGANELNYSFYWSNSLNTPTISVNSANTYSVTIQDVYGCFTYSDDIIISNGVSPAQPIISNNNNKLASSTIQGCTYRWFLDGKIVATGQFLNADTVGSGYYLVEAINSNGCGTLSDPLLVTSKNDASNDIKIYPVPATSELTIEVSNFYKSSKGQVSLINSLGQKITSQELNGKNKYTFNVSSLAIGIYTIQLVTDKENKRKKILITK